jgi:quercetin 2,3-dioxygenase
MPVKIFPEKIQHKGGFNGGEIVENKPIQVSEDGSKLQPYSNLFYWAHAVGKKESTIGLHPHQAFEIMSFVLKGEIEHYDTKNKTWKPLKAGDVQIIRAGNGISHAEKLKKDAEIFQIWLDPDVTKSYKNPATYDDYKAEDFPVKKENGLSIKTFKGDGAPMTMLSPGVTIQEINAESGNHKLKISANDILSLYVVDGNIKTGNETVHKDDFIRVSEETELTFSNDEAVTLFAIFSPAKVNYLTYASRYLQNAN